MRIYYQFTTTDPVIVSINNASANNHGSLDYIPGSAVLGALAAEHYPHLTAEASWNAFHNGNTRFSPAYPVVEQQLCLPVPASWHYEKGKNAIVNGHYNPEIISNHACKEFNRDSEQNSKKQFKQCRDGYFGSNGVSAEIIQTVATKTAIERNLGTAKEGQLFSYAHIDAGQTFAGWIECSDKTLLTKFKQSLNGTLRIGRSRNSEFGRVHSQLINSPPEVVLTENKSKTLLIWCLSDCEMLNAQGLATFTPELSSLHSKLQGTLNRELSFIRSSRISRFNQKRMGLDSEQLLISKGSVLVYDLAITADLDALEELQKNGIGQNRQQGLGWISINPQWALSPDLPSNELFPTINIIYKTFKPSNKSVETDLTLWLTSKLNTEKTSVDRQQQVTTLLKKIITAYTHARSYNNIYLSNEAGPSSNQWRRISDKVRNSNEPQWQQGIFEGENAICKASNDELGWGIEWSEANKITTFADCVRSTLQDKDLLTMRTLLDQLCRYDLSTSKGLKDIKHELKLTANNKGESV